MTTLPQRIRDAAEALKTPSNNVELFLFQNDDSDSRIEAIVEILEGIPDRFQSILDESKPPATRRLTASERAISLAHSIHAVVGDRGSCTLPVDALFDLIIERVDSDCRAFWESTGCQVIYGLIDSKDADLLGELWPLGISAEAFRADDGIAYEIRLTALADFDPPPFGSDEAGGRLTQPQKIIDKKPPSTDEHRGTSSEQGVRL